MFNKKGQVTIFIIIAVILIAVIGIFLLLNKDVDGTTGDVSSDSVYMFVEGCIEDTGNDAIYWIGQNGGYFFPPELSIDSGIPYYYHSGKNYVPYKEQVENEISKYIDNSLSFCTNNFEDFFEFDISQGEIKTKTIIKDYEIVVDLEYPLSITRGEETFIIKDWNDIKFATNLGIIHKVIRQFIQEQLNYGDFCLSCIVNLAGQSNLAVNLNQIQEGLVFSIGNENDLSEFPFEWIFINKYST